MSAPPLKPPRRNQPAPVEDAQAAGVATTGPVQASDEDIAGLVAEMDKADLAVDMAGATNVPKPVTADDITRRLQAEQEAAIRIAEEQAVLSTIESDGHVENEEIVIVGDFLYSARLSSPIFNPGGMNSKDNQLTPASMPLSLDYVSDGQYDAFAERPLASRKPSKQLQHSPAGRSNGLLGKMFRKGPPKHPKLNPVGIS
ncbi:hypothetical protein GGI10_005706, partial [Coemansia sp. RSA 2530]